MNKKIIGLSFFLLSSCSYIEFVPKPAPGASPSGPEVAGTQLQLLTAQERSEIVGTQYPSDSLSVISTLGTPAGYRLKLRFLELGISLVEGLKLSQDESMVKRLLDLAQYADREKVRAEALVTLAKFSDPQDLVYFQSALSDRETSIRLAAIEGLQSWGDPSGLPLLKSVMSDQWSPLTRIFAAQAVLSMGDSGGLPVLRSGLRDGSWLVRAMCARYLGDYGTEDDYDELYKAFQRETRNNFVVAELAIALLKLLSKKGADVVYAPALKGWKENKEVAYTVGKDDVVEMEPLVILPPRLYVPESQKISTSINRKLVTIIQNDKAGELSDTDKNDPNLEELNKMLTPTGFFLQTRYSELNYLLVESLAGTKNTLLRSELIRFAQSASNAVVRASALISLSYSQREEDVILITEALRSEDPIVRFGAMEAVMTGRFKNILPSVINIAFADPIPAFRIFAMNVMINFGDPTALDLLLTNLSNPDWPSRAMAYWYVGRYGREADHQQVLNNLNRPDNEFVLAEISLAVIRLAPLD